MRLHDQHVSWLPTCPVLPTYGRLHATDYLPFSVFSLDTETQLHCRSIAPGQASSRRAAVVLPRHACMWASQSSSQSADADAASIGLDTRATTGLQIQICRKRHAQWTPLPGSACTTVSKHRDRRQAQVYEHLSLRLVVPDHQASGHQAMCRTDHVPAPTWYCAKLSARQDA